MKGLNWILIATSVSLSGYATYASLQANSLRRLSVTAEVKHRQAESLLSDEVSLRNRANVLLRRQDFYIRCLGDLLSYCHSRDEFLIREGPWLVVGKLKTLDEQSRHFGVYLPAGRHMLKFAAADFSLAGQEGQMVSQQFFGSAPHQLTEVRSVPLEGPEVFEIRFSWRTTPGSTGVRLQVLGKENVVVFEQFQEFPADQIELLFSGKNTVFRGKDTVWAAAYPSELLIDGDVPRRPAYGHRPYRGLLELSGLRGYTESGGFRAWVESEAPPCISALKLGRHFSTIVGWREPVPIRQLAAFSSLFHPYDGSGKYVFRPGAFESLMERRGGTGFTR